MNAMNAMLPIVQASEEMPWWQRYVGLSFLEKNPCWSLVCQVYEEVYDIILPTLGDEVDHREFHARTVEGWARLDLPRPGALVLFRTAPFHVGIVTEFGSFLHVRDGQPASVERLDSAVWAQRIEGFYRYAELAEPVVVGSMPHPLAPTKVCSAVTAGLSLREIDAKMRADYPCSVAGQGTSVMSVDGRPVAEQDWDMVPDPGATVHHRIVAGKSPVFKSIAGFALSLGSKFLTPALGPVGSMLFYAGGSFLLNKLWPSEQPKNGAVEQGRRANLLNGGSNRFPLVGEALPFNLGLNRVTPDCVHRYIETIGGTSYIREIVVWSTGPQQISDIRSGDAPLDTLEECEYVTLPGDGTETAADIARFDAVAGQDVSQEATPIDMKRKWVWCGKTWSKVGSVATITCTEEHGFLVGWWLSIDSSDFALYEITAVPTPTTIQIVTSRTSLGDPDDDHYVHASPYEIKVAVADGVRTSIALHAPEGWRNINDSGSVDPWRGAFRVQYQKIDSITLAPLGSWLRPRQIIAETSIPGIPTAWYNTDGDTELEQVYCWYSLCLNGFGAIVLRAGSFTTNPNSDPSGLLLDRLKAAAKNKATSFTRLPFIPSGEIELWRICIFGSTIYAVQDQRGGITEPYTGLGLTLYDGVSIRVVGGGFSVSLRAVISAGEITNDDRAEIEFGYSGQKYYLEKDAFTINYSFTHPRGRYQVRVLRLAFDGQQEIVSGLGRPSSQMLWLSLTTFDNVKPVTYPGSLARTAIRRKVEDGSGTAPPISGTVLSIANDWTGTAWVKRPTRNPASMYRLACQGDQMARPYADAQFDLVGMLQPFHTFARVNGFMCDLYLRDRVKLDDLLRTVTATARSAPIRRNGKLGVVTDTTKPAATHVITPHNSWDWECDIHPPEEIHGLKIIFINSGDGFKENEMVVYADGYTKLNATKFRSEEFPGVTTYAALWKHGRARLAAESLRRQTHRVTMDVESIGFELGDRVSFSHYGALIGLGTGRVKTFINTTTLQLEEQLPFKANTAYSILLRGPDNDIVVRGVVAKTVAGLHDQITLATPVTADQGAAGNLFQFGEPGMVYADMIIQDVDIQNDDVARIEMQHYAPAIFTSDTQTIPVFDPQTTLPPNIGGVFAISQRPTITAMISNESAALVVANQYQWRIRVAFAHPPSLAALVTGVEAVAWPLNSVTGEPLVKVSVPISGAASIHVPDVIPGQQYRVDIRYIGSGGRTGPWTSSVNHTVVGRSIPIKPVTTLALSHAVATGSRMTWAASRDRGIAGTEVRLVDSGWGGATGYVFRGNATGCPVDPAAAGTTRTWYARFYDEFGNYSTTSASISLNVVRPGLPAVPGQDVIKAAAARIELALKDYVATPGTLPIAGYVVRLSNPLASDWGNPGYLWRGTATACVLTNLAVPALPTTSVTLYIRAVDTDGNFSAAARVVVHDFTRPATMATATVVVAPIAAGNLNVRMTAVPAKPGDFKLYELRVWQVRAAATTGDDTPDGTAAAATGDALWNDPDHRSVTTTSLVFPPLSLNLFPTPRFSTAGVVYLWAIRMVDTSGNDGVAQKQGSITVKQL